MKIGDIPFLQLSDNWRLASDPLQWVVQRRGSFDVKRGERRWNAVSFVATRRDILFRVLRELEAEVSPDAQAALDDLPQTFREWQKEHAGNAARKRFKGGAGAVAGGSLMRSRDAGKRGQNGEGRPARLAK